jgi:hypothetical protein
MPRRKTNSHTHQYHLRPYGSKGLKVYACALPNCTHFQLEKSLLIGKMSLCNQCGDPFMLSNETIAREVVRPRCAQCKEEKRLGGPRPKPKPVEEVEADNAIEKLRARLNLL